ncbi:EAL domain-containing protein [Cetobacterium somerae]|uniref:EAL domain-containing protein n=1 Tax=Cetobacterium sp. NK01 TaxID=2993530 RepID=UPI002115F50D|nr:EAL domain-containing protein [Cetobacterium sp. NK01]MCQ8212740.1 EAL domain-containing protein [Cetobacterium sp. NK01]
MNKQLENLLKFNLEDILKVAFQPIYSLEGEVKSFEVLSRFYNKENDLISTIKVINFLEKLDIIHQLDFLILKKIEKYLKKGKKIAINISPLTILMDEFIEKINLLKCDLSNLEIELTERGNLDYEKLIIRVNQLHKLGIKVAIDDFPIENSSLETLLKTKINKVKIDRSLLNNIDCPLGKETYRGIVALLKTMKHEITTEGIETKEQFDFIKEIGVDFIQGYYIGEPILENELLF